MYKYMYLVETLLEEIIDNYNFKKSSIPFYKGRVNKFFKEYMSLPENENRPIDTLSYYDINIYLKNLEYSAAEKVNHFQALKCFFTYTYNKGLTQDIMIQVNKPIADKKPKEIIKEEHYDKLVEFISNRNNDIKDRLILGLFLYTGLSRKYIYQLRNRQFMYEHGGYRLIIWKGEMEFILPLKTELQIIIHEYIIQLSPEEYNNKVIECDENYLSTLIRQLCKKACGKSYTPTTLSNTFIYKALKNGNNVWEVSKLTLESLYTIQDHVTCNDDLICRQVAILNSF